MNNLINNIFPLLLSILPIDAMFAQDKSMNSIESLYAAENSFANMSKQQSMKKAFLANLTDSTILFFKGEPVIGKPIYEKLPESDQQLFWWPTFGAISTDATLGFTTGPFTWAKDKQSEPIAFGHYFTIWGKNKNNQWQVLLDVGINHAKPIDFKKEIVHSDFAKAHVQTKEDRRIALQILIKSNDELAIKRKSDFDESIMANDWYLCMREGEVPIVNGRPTINLPLIELSTKAIRYSQDHSLAFSYGTAKTENTGIKYFFLKVWKFENGKWKLLVDLLGNN